MAKPIEIHVRLSAAAFRHYCDFNAFRRRRRWFLPALVGLVLINIATVLLIRGSGDGVLAGVLMGLGIAVPALAFGLYYLQIRVQIAAQGLKASPAVYSLRLAPEGLTITNDRKAGDAVSLPWDRVWAAFRGKDAVYLYATTERAFILPDGQADAPDEAVWRALREYLGDAKCVPRRKQTK